MYTGDLNKEMLGIMTFTWQGNNAKHLVSSAPKLGLRLVNTVMHPNPCSVQHNAKPVSCSASRYIWSYKQCRNSGFTESRPQSKSHTCVITRYTERDCFKHMHHSFWNSNIHQQALCCCYSSPYTPWMQLFHLVQACTFVPTLDSKRHATWCIAGCPGPRTRQGPPRLITSR